jgi:hypothetical protein
MFTLANLVPLLISFTLTVRAAPVGVGPTPDVGSVYAVYPGWDMDNGNNGQLNGGTEQGCLKACSTSGFESCVHTGSNLRIKIAGSTCVAYVYVPYGSSVTGPGPVCILKNSFNVSAFKTQSFDISVGLFGPCGT